MQLSLPDLGRPEVAPELPTEKAGQVWTRDWVVRAILDFAGYVETSDLAVMRAVEPAAGEGAFLGEMVQRLLASCARHGRTASESLDAIQAFDLDPSVAERSRLVVESALATHAVPVDVRHRLANAWVRNEDFLLAAPSLPWHADFVLGNPPYIRQEDLPGDRLSLYRSTYGSMRGRADIYVAFIEAALGLLNRGGVCAYICADRWMLNAYGAELRRMVTSRFAVEVVVEMHNAPAFEEEVSAYPAIVVLRNADQGPVIVGSAGADVDTSATGFTAARLAAVAGGGPEFIRGANAIEVKTWSRGTDPWPLLSPQRLGILQRLEARFDVLESTTTGTRVGIGVATGADRVYVVKEPPDVEEDRLLPLAMASDTSTGALRWSGHHLVNPWNAEGLVGLDMYPRLAAYLTASAAQLRGRNVATRQPRNWYRTIDRVIEGLTQKDKLYFPDIKGYSNPVLDRGETYPHHNLYWVTSDTWDLEVLGGLLMSRVAQLFVEAYAVRMRGGALRFQAQYLRRIRVPEPQSVPDDIAHALREAFRSRDAAAATQAALVAYDIDEAPEVR